MRIYTCVCIYVRTYIRMYVCMYECVQGRKKTIYCNIVNKIDDGIQIEGCKSCLSVPYVIVGEHKGM